MLRKLLYQFCLEKAGWELTYGNMLDVKWWFKPRKGVKLVV